MTIRHGKNAQIYLAGYDISGDLNLVTPHSEVDLADQTCFGATGHSWLPGLFKDEAQIEGFLDDTAAVRLDALHAVETTGYQLMVLYGTTLGDAAQCANEVKLQTYSKNAVANDINKITAKCLTENYPFDPCVLLSPKATKTTAGSGTGLNNLAGSTDGLVAYLQVFAVGAGKTLTVTIDHSDDGAAWTAGLISFTGATAITTERKAVAGNVKQYLRATWAFAGGAPYTASFALCVCRNTV